MDPGDVDTDVHYQSHLFNQSAVDELLLSKGLYVRGWEFKMAKSQSLSSRSLQLGWLTNDECNPGVCWMLGQMHKDRDILCAEVLEVPKCIHGFSWNV